MIEIGEYQKLTIISKLSRGNFLRDEEGEIVLMPKQYCTADMNIDDEVDVIVYRDRSETVIATTEKPLLTVDGFGYLQVRNAGKSGVFCDWGVSKDLFVPFVNQAYELEVDQKCVVHMFVDTVSDRLVGSTKLNKYLQFLIDDELKTGQEVELLVAEKSDLGYNVIIDQRFGGLIYDNEIHQSIDIGQQLKGYIKPIREDGRIDVSLYPIGHKSIEPNAALIMEKLKDNNGHLPFHDKSDPDDIRQYFGISKKLFKKSLGNLYRQRLVELKDDGIHLR